jgi:hypothetical protein
MGSTLRHAASGTRGRKFPATEKGCGAINRQRQLMGLSHTSNFLKSFTANLPFGWMISSSISEDLGRHRRSSCGRLETRALSRLEGENRRLQEEINIEQAWWETARAYAKSINSSIIYQRPVLFSLSASAGPLGRGRCLNFKVT